MLLVTWKTKRILPDREYKGETPIHAGQNIPIRIICKKTGAPISSSNDFTEPGRFFNREQEAGSRKQSYHSRKVDRGFFCFAGLWEEWSLKLIWQNTWNGIIVISLRLRALCED